MEGSWNEYIDLISSASLDLYPQNLPSNFTNKLAVPQQLPENAYIGLEEMSYVNTFYNIMSHRYSIIIYDMLFEYPPHAGRPKTYGKYFPVKLKEGYYDTYEKICDAINLAIQTCGVPQVAHRDIFTYDPVSMKFSYDVASLWLTLFIDGDMLNYLGVELHKATESQYVTLGRSKTGPSYKYPASIISMEERFYQETRKNWIADRDTVATFPHVAQLSMIDSFIIYIDCISSQLTGDSFSDALRIVPIKGSDKTGTNVSTHFIKPYFLKVNKRYISSISIQIKDPFDNFIDFKQGFVRLKLRFITQ